MSEKYVLFVPGGGLNDCLSRIWNVIMYCSLKNRTLLLDFTRSTYAINMSDFFTIRTADYWMINQHYEWSKSVGDRFDQVLERIPDGNYQCRIIYDTNEILNVLQSLQNSNNLSVHPNNLDFNLCDLYNGNGKNIQDFEYVSNPFSPYAYKGTTLDLPDNANESVILHSCCGGGEGYNFFKQLGLNDNIKSIIRKKLASLTPGYLCIQVRNTDYRCDYKGLYSENKEFIRSFPQVYLCTDDPGAFKFLKSTGLNVECFTTFPDIVEDVDSSQAGADECTDENGCCGIHHNSNADKTTHMQDVLVDILIATNSKSILSNSKGGFINLLRKCHENKDWVNQMLE